MGGIGLRRFTDKAKCYGENSRNGGKVIQPVKRRSICDQSGKIVGGAANSTKRRKKGMPSRAGGKKPTPK